MTAWPNATLNKHAPNSAYTCQATSNKIGPGVSSTIEIAVDCKCPPLTKMQEPTGIFNVQT